MNAVANWVAGIDASEANGLAALRLLPDLEVAPLAAEVWLRGPSWNDTLALALQKISGLRRFTVRADGQLIAEGHRVPKGRLMATQWRPLREWLAVALPPALGATRPNEAASLRLVRSGLELPAHALLTDIVLWLAWAEEVSAVRLRPLRFAAARDGRVWIEGIPLPAIAGQRFHLQEGVAVPCGFACEPALESRVLKRWLALREGDTAFAHADGTWEILREEQFVPALRSAVRLTAEALGHG